MVCTNCYENMRGPFNLCARKRVKWICDCGRTIETNPKKPTGISAQKLAAIRKNRSLEYFGEKEVRAEIKDAEVRLPSEQIDEED